MSDCVYELSRDVNQPIQHEILQPEPASIETYTGGSVCYIARSNVQPITGGRRTRTAVSVPDAWPNRDFTADVAELIFAFN